jgi:hypothetical protein
MPNCAPPDRIFGHISPLAWAMDGFQNVAARGLGLNTVLLPAAALVSYAAVFFTLAAWRFWAATAPERPRFYGSLPVAPRRAAAAF